jgi:hypothetical protein
MLPVRGVDLVIMRLPPPRRLVTTAAGKNAVMASYSVNPGLTDGAADQTKARYAFVYGDFRRIHRMGIIACIYRAAEWRHKEVELAAHDLLQRLDKLTS